MCFRPPTSSRILWCTAVCLGLAAALPPVARAQSASDPQAEDNRTARSAVYLLQQAVTVRRDGRHNRLLRALRHRRDPAMRTLFERLAGADHPALRIHSILGLAELKQPEPTLDVSRLAEVTEAAVQAEVVTAAMDDDLLALNAAGELLDWKDLDQGVKLLVAARLLANRDTEQPFAHMQLLRESLDARRAARRGLAALMLHHLGETAGTEALNTLSRSDDPQRDDTLRMLVRTALKHKLHNTAKWGYALTTDDNVSPKVRLGALRLALRFGDPRAPELWEQRFASDTDPAARNRLALMALELAPWLETRLFESMQAAAQRELIEQIARTGLSITGGAADVPDQVVKLVRMEHPMASRWALGFARDHANANDAQLILLGIVLAYEEGARDGRVRRLDNAVRAVQLLHEQDPRVAANMVRPILAGEKTDPLLKRGILLGLVRTQKAGAHRVLEGLPPFTQPKNAHLALLLRANAGQPLSDKDMDELALLVRGGGGLQPSVRIQAAWAWLKRTGRADAALRTALDLL